MYSATAPSIFKVLTSSAILFGDRLISEAPGGSVSATPGYSLAQMACGPLSGGLHGRVAGGLGERGKAHGTVQGGGRAPGYNRTMGGPVAAGREPELVRSKTVVNRRAGRARDWPAATAAAQ